MPCIECGDQVVPGEDELCRVLDQLRADYDRIADFCPPATWASVATAREAVERAAARVEALGYHAASDRLLGVACRLAGAHGATPPRDVLAMGWQRLASLWPDDDAARVRVEHREAGS